MPGLQSAGGVGAVKLVQVRTSNSLPWTSLTNTFGSAWEIGNAPSYPLDVNIVGADGESVSTCSLPACKLDNMPALHVQWQSEAHRHFLHVQWQSMLAQLQLKLLMRCCNGLQLVPDAADALQVSAYQIIKGAGTLGQVPTNTQFSIADPTDTAVSSHAPMLH